MLCGLGLKSSYGALSTKTENFLPLGFPGGSEVKVSACNAGDLGSVPGSSPWVRKIPWGREWLPTPVFWPGEFYEQRSLVGYSPWGPKESETTD